MTKTYLGSCHCGAVRFEIDMDFASTGSSKCNCTYCWKQRNWNAAGMKPDAFRLIAGEDVLGDYSRSGEGFETHHRFSDRRADGGADRLLRRPQRQLVECASRYPPSLAAGADAGT